MSGEWRGAFDLMDASLDAMARGDHETAIALAREANRRHALRIELKNKYLPQSRIVSPFPHTPSAHEVPDAAE
jgi:hypothetical protein